MATEVVPPADQDTREGDVREQHPQYVARSADWAKMRDARDGEWRIKQRQETYLPKPSGFTAQSDQGAAMYESYITRAKFPEITSPTVLAMVGVVCRDEPHMQGLEEGGELAYLWESATPDGHPLEVLHRTVVEELLTCGRVILLPDLPKEGSADDLPRIAVYKAESLVNWSEDRDFFVLEESYRERRGYSWTGKTRWRVLELTEDGTYRQEVVQEDGSLDPTPEPAGDKAQKVRSRSVAESVSPVARGGKSLTAVPIVVAGSRDLSLEPDEVPLISVASAAIAAYRLDADYRHQLFMSGQETLFTIGLAKEDAPSHVGAGVVVTLPDGGDAKYVGPTGVGIQAHRLAIQDEMESAAAAGAKLLDTGTRGAESGEALRIRGRATTASLVSVALSAAAAIEQAIRHCAVMINADPKSVVVVPNLDWTETPMTPQQAKELMEVWMARGISYETYYENLRRGGIASQERTAAEEQELVAQEDAAVAEDVGTVPGTELAPEDDPSFGNDETGDVPQDDIDALFDEELVNS